MTDNAPSPATEAGREIVEELHSVHRIRERGNWIVAQDHAIGDNAGKCVGCDAVSLVAAIEAQARLAALAEVEEAVKALTPVRKSGDALDVDRTAVLAAIHSLRGPNDD